MPYKDKEKKKEHRKKYYFENIEKWRKYHRTYYIKNSEKIKAATKKYQQEHKEEIAVYKIKYEQENKPKISATKKKYYQKNKEKIKARCLKNHHNRYSVILKIDAWCQFDGCEIDNHYMLCEHHLFPGDKKTSVVLCFNHHQIIDHYKEGFYESRS